MYVTVIVVLFYILIITVALCGSIIVCYIIIMSWHFDMMYMLLWLKYKITYCMCRSLGWRPACVCDSLHGATLHPHHGPGWKHPRLLYQMYKAFCFFVLLCLKYKITFCTCRFGGWWPASVCDGHRSATLHPHHHGGPGRKHFGLLHHPLAAGHAQISHKPLPSQSRHFRHRQGQSLLSLRQKKKRKKGMFPVNQTS